MAHTLINPATGLPMTGDDFGGVDAGGSPCGIYIHAHHHPWSAPYSAWDGGGWESF